MNGRQSQRKRKRTDEESSEGASGSSISLEATDIRSDQHDVFLSFRGSDTRKEFVDHLYHSLVKAGTTPFCVFKDDKSIPIGEEFGLHIIDAITHSKISIPIISENYASRKWCLRELFHIMECKKSMSHKVLPIFYKVAPSDVRHLKGNFGKAFISIQERCDKKDIQDWQQALNEVSDLNGWESQKIANGYEGELIERVVKTVMSKLQEDFQLHVPKELVGLDGCLKEIMNWVHSPFDKARMIGIYGMGGIGKTTLAKCIYNHLSYEITQASFLPDIREKATQCHGMEDLQSQLIYDVLQRKIKVSRIDDGVNIIKSRFKGKKVLILLDDVDDKNQLDSLAREYNWFMAGSIIIVTTRNEAILDQSEFEVDYKYELSELDEMNSILLFNRHAFRMNYSPRDFEGISRDIISIMGGLPLALQVVGSYLYNKTNRKVWEDVQKKLKNQPHRDVQKTLQISYDALEDGHKQIFLDIVCFFIGEDGKFAMHMWEDCGLYPSQGLEELKLRCLIKIGDDGEFRMHDQLRDLGRSIFCQGQSLEKCSGPWDFNYKGVPRVLRQEKSLWFHHLLRAASSRDSNEVRCVHWKNVGGDLSTSTTNLHLPKLSVLDFSFSNITEDWKGWNSIMASKRLKVLDLGYCCQIRCTPDLSTLTQLKILILNFCSQLKRLHPSIGKLKSLVSLELCSCSHLKELPDEVGELRELEELVLDWTGITKIPMFVGSLRRLKKLSAIGCFSIRDSPSLQHLDMSGFAVEELPSAIERLENMQNRAIPSGIGDLSLLEILDISGTRISVLPGSIWGLSSLQRLDLSGCYNLKSLPELPLGLTCLSVSCQSPRLPQLSGLIHLKELHLHACHLLEDIPKLSSRLLKLCVEECEKLILLRIDVFEYLEELSIKECSSIERLDLSQLIYLKQLHVEHCNNLVEIEGHDNLESLEYISIHDCNSIKRLSPELRSMKKSEAIQCNKLLEVRDLYGASFNIIPFTILTGLASSLTSIVTNGRSLE